MVRIKFVKRTGKKQLRSRWRKPKGMHNKQRLARKGRPRRPKIGFGKGKKAKEIIRTAKISFVGNMDDVAKVGKGQEIVLAGNLGKRKKLIIIHKLLEKGVHVKNLDAGEFIKKYEKVKKEKEKAVKKEGKKEKEEKEKVEEKEKAMEEKRVKEEKVKEQKIEEKKTESKPEEPKEKKMRGGIEAKKENES